MRSRSGRSPRGTVRLLGIALGLALLVPLGASSPVAADGARPGPDASPAAVATCTAPSPATKYPALPVAEDASFLTNLTLPSVAPGGPTSISFRVGDPAGSGGPLSDVVVSFQVYEFNGFPGNATACLPVADAPALVNATASGNFVTVSLPDLTPGTSEAGSVGVVTASDTPAGTFAVRTAVNFTLGAAKYRLESRGWFTAAEWAEGTEAPNGSAILNLSYLGNVSGVVPETALFVSPGGWDVALAALLVGGIVLVGVGAYVYFRRTAGSRSGAG
jgi:hypothetical protein